MNTFPSNTPWRKENFEAVGFFYLDIREDQGNGDLLYNTFRVIIETDDHSPWAYKALERCFDCLVWGIRWPDDMAQYIKVDPVKQYLITRDPWILGYCCAVHLERIQFISASPPQWWLYRPKVWEWRKQLIGDKNCYVFWRKVNSIFKKDYVKDLDEWMRWAVDKTHPL
jgi:hypothetical protein